MTRFAQDTRVTVENSRAEIERMINRYGATQTAFFNAADRSAIVFECHGRRIMFTIPLPARDDHRFALDGNNRRRTPQKRQAVWEQACRQRWRAMALVIKAKLEAVESGIVSFEDEFLAHIVMPDCKTVSSHVTPGISAAYDTGTMVPLLPAPQ